MADLLELGAGLLGGLLGSSASGSRTQQDTAKKDPWAPAQPYILSNLQNEAALQTQLQKTPFNPQQIQGYSNLFGDIGNFRDNVMPGLMDFANRGMTSSYQRQAGGAVGSGGGYGGAVRPGGLLQSGQGPFGINRGAGGVQNGLLDLNGAQNTYANGQIKAPMAQAPVAAPGASSGLLGTGGGGSGNGNLGGAAGGSYGGSADGSLSLQQAALSAIAAGDTKALKALSPMLAALFGLGGGAVADQQMGVIGRDMGALNDQAAAGGIDATGIGTRSDPNANVSTFSNPLTIAAQDRAMFGGMGGGYGGNYGGSNVGRSGSEGGYGGDSSHGTAGW
jgi:hypothetical protein